MTTDEQTTAATHVWDTTEQIDSSLTRLSEFLDEDNQKDAKERTGHLWDKERSLLDNLECFNDMLSKDIVPHGMLKKTFKFILAQAKKDEKARDKVKNKRKARDPNKPPTQSGFAKPVPITPELAKFLGYKTDEHVARTEVTRTISKWIKEHECQDPKNGQNIMIDSKPARPLKKLLGTINTADKPLTFFRMQKYLKHHFPKNEKAET